MSLFLVAKRYACNFAPGNWACAHYWQNYSELAFFKSKEDVEKYISSQEGKDSTLPVHWKEPPQPRWIEKEGSDYLVYEEEYHWRVWEVAPGTVIDPRD